MKRMGLKRIWPSCMGCWSMTRAMELGLAAAAVG